MDMKTKKEIQYVTFTLEGKERMLTGKTTMELLGWINMTKESYGLKDEDFSEIKTMKI